MEIFLCIIITLIVILYFWYVSIIGKRNGSIENSMWTNFYIKQAVENPQVQERNMIVKSYHRIIGEFKSAGNPIKMSTYKDENTRGDIPDLDEHREKIIKEFS